MSILAKGDKVKIINTNDVWENLTGTVLEESENKIITDEGRDLTDVYVKINLPDSDKKVIQPFKKENIKLLPLDESLVDLTESFEDVNSFVKAFKNKTVMFSGLPYEEVYQVHEIAKGEFDFNDEDKEEINLYKSHEGKLCKILSCSISDGFEAYNSSLDNFNSCYWDVEFEDGVKFYTILGSRFLIKEDDKILTESLETEETNNILDTDFIKDYVYLVDIDDNEIPSWFFTAQLAIEENISEDAVIEAARKYKYKLYRIEAPEFCKMIVAAKKCDAEDINDEYGNYLQGNATITEVE